MLFSTPHLRLKDILYIFLLENGKYWDRILEYEQVRLILVKETDSVHSLSVTLVLLETVSGWSEEGPGSHWEGISAGGTVKNVPARSETLSFLLPVWKVFCAHKKLADPIFHTLGHIICALYAQPAMLQYDRSRNFLFNLYHKMLDFEQTYDTDVNHEAVYSKPTHEVANAPQAAHSWHVSGHSPLMCTLLVLFLMQSSEWGEPDEQHVRGILTVESFE